MTQTRVELGFTVAHADIGGGFENSDLSKVALAWMVEQAIVAGIKMNDPTGLHTIIANPVTTRATISTQLPHIRPPRV